MAQNTSNKRRAVTIHPPARLVSEPKKTKKEGRKERRKTTETVANWLFAQTTQSPTSSDQNQTLHGGWPAVCSYTYQVWSKSVKGLRRCGGSKMALSYYFGQWLIQQLVPPYKPWWAGSPPKSNQLLFSHAATLRKISWIFFWVILVIGECNICRHLMMFYVQFVLRVKQHEYRYQVLDICWAVIRCWMYDSGDTFITLSGSNRLASTNTPFICDGTLNDLC